jgi:predicted ATPase
MSHWSHKFIITGCPGSGKTTLIKHLRDIDIPCVDEPARQVIAEQRAIQGDGLSDRNVLLFTELLLAKSLDSYKKYEGLTGREFCYRLQC